MDDLQSLEQRIQERLNLAKQKTESQKDQLQNEMVGLEKHLVKFEDLASEFMTKVIKPRMMKLASLFDNAELLENNNDELSVCVCEFKHSDIYPASVKLTLSIFHDIGIENLLLGYKLDILPIFFKFVENHQVVFSLDDPNHEEMVDWIDEKILEFVDVYMQLAQTDQYQHHLQVTDPVCGMRFRKRIASAEMEHNNQTYFFCSHDCHDNFQSDPQQYVSRKHHLS